MNANRRKRIDAILEKLSYLRGDVEELQSEEQESFENMPESLQQGERGEKAQQAADALQCAVDGFDEITTNLEEATAQ